MKGGSKGSEGGGGGIINEKGMKQKQNALFAAQNQCKLTVSKGRGLGTQGRGRGCLGTVLMCLWLLRNWQSIRATNNVGNYALADD